MFCHGNLAHTGRGNRLCSDTFKQAKQLCKSRVPHRKYIAFPGAIKAEPNHPDEVLPPVTFPRRRLAGPAGSCRCTRPKRQQPPGTTSQRAPPPHTAPGTPRPPAPHNASGIPQSARLGSARAPAAWPLSAPERGQSGYDAPAPAAGAAAEAQGLPAPISAPTGSFPEPIVLLAPGRARCSGVPGSTSDTGDPAPTAPPHSSRETNSVCLWPPPPAGRIRAVNRPEGSIGAGGPRPSTGARPAVPRAHRRDVRRLRPSSPSSPGALRAGTAGAQPGARRLRPPLSAFFVAVKA